MHVASLFHLNFFQTRFLTIRCSLLLCVLQKCFYIVKKCMEWRGWDDVGRERIMMHHYIYNMVYNPEWVCIHACACAASIFHPSQKKPIYIYRHRYSP